jgi:hypothetical protein
MATKIQVVSALYLHKAKAVIVTSTDHYDFEYKNIVVHMVIDTNEIVFSAKKIGRKELSKAFSMKIEKTFEHTLKKCFSTLDGMLKGKTK